VRFSLTLSRMQLGPEAGACRAPTFILFLFRGVETGFSSPPPFPMACQRVT